MSAAIRVSEILRADPIRWRLLGVVAGLDLPDCWIGAGFVRSAVWHHLHGRANMPLEGDIDVIWYNADCIDAAEDRRLEAQLAMVEPSFVWSAKNQARMHTRNGDAPYVSSSDAMTHWPETATAVAARRRGSNGCEIAAPLGLDDLLDLVLRPTPRFRIEKRAIYEQRVLGKSWTKAWPLLTRAPA